jgi:hypothetical protein
LHLAWSTWCACAAASLTRRRWIKIAAFAYPVVTLFVVMGTANHFFVDGVGGWIVLALGWWLSAALSRRLAACRRARAGRAARSPGPSSA